MKELAILNIKYEIHLLLSNYGKGKKINFDHMKYIKVLAPVFTGVGTFSFFIGILYRCRGPPSVKLRKLLDWRKLKCLIDLKEENIKIIHIF